MCQITEWMPEIHMSTVMCLRKKYSKYVCGCKMSDNHGFTAMCLMK